MRERYFDNAATTPMDPRVFEEMRPFLTEEFGNANSIHGWGMRAQAAVEVARERVAQLIGAEDPQQIVFTSGATESNNWILSVLANNPGWISPFEHSAVKRPADCHAYQILQNNGLTLMPPQWHEMTNQRPLLSVMSVNNEIGARWDVRNLVPPEGLRPLLHSDITQQAGKLPTDVAGLDYASFSAHKFHGPKGVGGLYIADAPPRPLLVGGEQEFGLRSGTLNVPGIVGMGAAAAIAIDELQAAIPRAKALRSLMLDEILTIPDVMVHGGEDVSPYILSVSFEGIEGETLVIESDQAGYAISGGAACSSQSSESSWVLSALEVEEPFLRGTVRISFGKYNSYDSATKLAKIITTSVEKLRRMR
jgi:cysteine desulfurase